MAFEQTPKKDWYSILGANPSASISDLKQNYQKLILMVSLFFQILNHAVGRGGGISFFLCDQKFVSIKWIHDIHCIIWSTESFNHSLTEEKLLWGGIVVWCRRSESRWLSWNSDSTANLEILDTLLSPVCASVWYIEIIHVNCLEVCHVISSISI